MKCANCGAEWTPPKGSRSFNDVCPFCGKQLQDIEYKTFDDVFSVIVLKHGADTLCSGAKASGLFADYAPKLQREHALLKKFYACNGSGILIQVIEHPNERDVLKRQVVTRMKEEWIAEEAAELICNSFLHAIEPQTRSFDTKKDIKTSSSLAPSQVKQQKGDYGDGKGEKESEKKSTVNGFCVQHNSDGSITEGYKENGEWNGKFKKTYKNGSYFEGTYSSGKCNGMLTYVNSQGLTTRGIWENNNWNGVCSVENEDGSITSGKRTNGVWTGDYTKLLKDGSFYRGTFVNGEIQGNVTFSSCDGSIFVCPWENGDFKGVGKYTSKKGVLTGTWENGEVAHDCNYHYADGKEYEGKIRNFKRDGQGLIRFPNGAVLNAVFKEDQIVGEVHIMFPDMSEYTGMWNGRAEGQGTFISFYCGKASKICYEGKWKSGTMSDKNGKLVVANNKDEQILYQGSFVAGKASGFGMLYSLELSGSKEPLDSGMWNNNCLNNKTKSRATKKAEYLIEMAIDYINTVTEEPLIIE